MGQLPDTARVLMADLGTTIMLRESIDALFDQLEARPERSVTFDFRDVEFVSRSSAHEYLTRKMRCRLPCSESGIGPEVYKMLQLVKRQLERSKNGTPRAPAPWSTAPLQQV